MKSRPSGPGKDLRAIQRAFAAGVTRRLTADHRMQPKWIDGESTEKAAAAFIKPNDRLTSFERLEIYNKQYWFRLLDCLYEDFPGLRTVIGDDRFREMSIAYLTKYPSNSYALGDLGRRLEKFLVQEPHWMEPNPKLAREIVRLEWAHIAAFDGDELPLLEIDALLDGGDPATLRLAFQPHLTFLECNYPVDNFILAVRRREEPRGEASNAVAERLPRKATKRLKLPEPKKIYLAVHRSENSVWYKRLEPRAYAICSALRKGLTLQAACARALRHGKADENFGATLQAWFAQWASFGWFCRAE
jgi:hypothetical protein